MKEVDAKVIQLHTAIGRNDPCPCGSGKKYKKCCLSKHEEEKLSQSVANTETVSDKYFSVQEYISEVGYPVLNFDYFLLELLNITAGVLYRYGKISRENEKELIKGLIKEAKRFFSVCKNCEVGCLNDPMKKITFKSLIDKGWKIEKFPLALQKPVSINFFYFEFINIFIAHFSKELKKIMLEHEVEEVVSAVHDSIFDFVAESCWERCDNSCISEHEKNAYCSFCSFGKGKLPCPKDNEISYADICASEADMKH